MSEWNDYTSESVRGTQSPRGTDLDELDLEGPDPDDDCLGPDDPGVGPWIHEFDD